MQLAAQLLWINLWLDFLQRCTLPHQHTYIKETFDQRYEQQKPVQTMVDAN
jgi:hypothetical protein